MIFEFSGHAGDQVDVVVHATAHTAVHQRANGWLLGTRIKEVLCFVVAVHRAPGESILGGKRYNWVFGTWVFGKVPQSERISHRMQDSTEIDLFKQVLSFVDKDLFFAIKCFFFPVVWLAQLLTVKQGLHRCENELPSPETFPVPRSPVPELEPEERGTGLCTGEPETWSPRGDYSSLRCSWTCGPSGKYDT